MVEVEVGTCRHVQYRMRIRKEVEIRLTLSKSGNAGAWHVWNTNFHRPALQLKCRWYSCKKTVWNCVVYKAIWNLTSGQCVYCCTRLTVCAGISIMIVHAWVCDWTRFKAWQIVNSDKETCRLDDDCCWWCLCCVERLVFIALFPQSISAGEAAVFVHSPRGAMAAIQHKVGNVWVKVT